jgi:ribosomal-protein-alanine N-acetyltransferase
MTAAMTRGTRPTATLRPMRWWDIEVLPSIEHGLFGADAWSAEQFWSELAGVPGSRWYVVAAEAGPAGETVVGYAGLASAADVADVQTMAVRPDRQGTGLGGLLLDALLAEAAGRGCTEVFLEVRRDNAPARALYARRGFTQVAVRARYYGDGTDALVLRRPTD